MDGENGWCCDRPHATEGFIGRRLSRTPACGKKDEMKEGKKGKIKTKETIFVLPRVLALGPANIKTKEAKEAKEAKSVNETKKKNAAST